MKRVWCNTAAGRLEVIESAGQGPVVFLCHGNSGCADDFAPVLDSDLGRRWRLVSISLPGHGASDRARDPMGTYGMAGFGAAVAQVVASYECPAYGLVGQSLGGHVLLESLAELPGARGLLLLSSPPLSVQTLPLAFQPDPTGGALFAPELSPTQVEAMVRAFVNTTEGRWADQVRHGLQQADPRMRECLGKNLPRILDERLLFEEAPIPVALMGGSEDAFLRADYWDTLPWNRMWSGKPVLCDGKPHALHLTAVDEVAHLLSRLLSEVMEHRA